MQKFNRFARRFRLAAVLCPSAMMLCGGAMMLCGAVRAADEEAPALRRLDPKQPLWIDAARKRVVMVGQVCLREGQLELFACPTGSKEHESVLSVPVDAFKVHAALVAV